MDFDSSDMQRFLRLLAHNLEENGVSKTVFTRCVEISRRQMMVPENDAPVFTRTPDDSGATDKSRGVDYLGRIIVEYSFFKTPDEQMIWPDNSPMDLKARDRFMDTVIPRPLMRYFLATLRGPVMEIDGMDGESIIWGEPLAVHRRQREEVTELVKEFMGPFGFGESAVEWDRVYEDARCKTVAMAAMDTTVQAMESFGLEAYVQAIETLHANDPQRDGLNNMNRRFMMEDATQLRDALKMARTSLAQEVH